MKKDDLESFHLRVLDEIQSNIESKPPIESFTEIYLDYLKESSQKTDIYDYEVVTYQKELAKMRINAIAINRGFNSLTLLVSDYSPLPNLQKIGKIEAEKLLKLGVNFYKNCKSNYFENVDSTSLGYHIYRKIKDEIPNPSSINIFLLTDRISKEGNNAIPENIEIDNVPVLFDVWDLERIWLIASKEESVKPLEISYPDYTEDKKTPLQLIKVNSDNIMYDCYVGAIPGLVLAKIFKNTGQRLLEQNVRAYLSRTGKVNNKIHKTLLNHPEMFMAYNNGISTIADSITVAASTEKNIVNILNIDGWQIVNGGQTTVSLYNAYKEGAPLENVYVQIKLTVLKCESQRQKAINKIALYANSQNPVKDSDFSSNEEYHLEMHRLSTYIPVPTEDGRGKSDKYWYYENSRGEYYTEYYNLETTGEKKKFKATHTKITKTEAARCWMLWNKMPWFVARGLETNFDEFTSLLNQEDGPVSKKPRENEYIQLIAQYILFKQTDRIIAKRKYGDWKAPQTYYTISLLSEKYGTTINLKDIWNHQSISLDLANLIEEIADFVWDVFMNPPEGHQNIGQWCKKDYCWELMVKKFNDSFHSTIL